MADFNTHVFGAAGVASLSATCATKLFALSMPEALVLMGVGIIGGVLPDIDLGKSTPSKVLFSILGIAVALIWLVANIERYSALELWLGTLVLFILVRFPVAEAFNRFTVHRGALHSLIAAVMVGSVTCALAWQYLQASALQSWLLGLSLSLGYIVHLALDELYSVNFLGASFKRSFGSALKVFDIKRPIASSFIVLIALAGFYWSAPIDDSFQQISSGYTNWRTVLLPQWW